MKKEVVLLADVGGTNVRFGTYRKGDEDVNFDKKYLVSSFKSFEEAVQKYLEETSKKPSLCVIGAAGSIDEEKGEVLTSNTPWRVSVSKLKAKFPQLKSVSLDNDFALQGWAISGLEPHQYRSLFSEEQKTDLTSSKVVVLGLGTGCGTCLLLKNAENEQMVYTSESGHSSIPHVVFSSIEKNAQRDRVLKALKKYYKTSQFCGKKGNVVEHIISGTGVQNVYYALKDGFIPKPDSRITSYEIEKLAQSGDKTALRTFDFIFAYLGAHTGSVAATVKADHIFYCGGLLGSSWVQQRLEQSDDFKVNFARRAGMTNAMKQMKFSVSLYREMAEKGAVVRAKKLLGEYLDKEAQRRSNRDLIQSMSAFYLLLEDECPQALPQMKRVIRAVEHFRRISNKNAKQHQRGSL